MAADLISRARAGDGEAFGQLVEPYRRELQVHCYRILGSAADAEDALQETLLSAWQGLGGFERRASVRTWLYRVATNRCLNALRSANRRPPMDWPLPGVDPPEPTRLGEVVWLEPYPDALLEGLADSAPGPEARYEATEAISLAFVTALQLLPPRQRAVLILRDVLGFRASEAAHVRDPQAGLARANGLLVLTLAGSRISAMTRFDNSVLPRFCLPRILPAAGEELDHEDPGRPAGRLERGRERVRGRQLAGQQEPAGADDAGWPWLVYNLSKRGRELEIEHDPCPGRRPPGRWQASPSPLTCSTPSGSRPACR